MEYQYINGSYYVRADKGESLTNVIKEICRKENIRSGHFQGIGACDHATVSTYIPEKNDFIDHEINGMIEMVSLMGNVSVDCNGEPFLHTHATFSYLNQRNEIAVIAGHMKDAHISYTGEIILQGSSEQIKRKFDDYAGIEVWHLNVKN